MDVRFTVVSPYVSSAISAKMTAVMVRSTMLWAVLQMVSTLRIMTLNSVRGSAGPEPDNYERSVNARCDRSESES